VEFNILDKGMKGKRTKKRQIHSSQPIRIFTCCHPENIASGNIIRERIYYSRRVKRILPIPD
jgi:hypothetical protein